MTETERAKVFSTAKEAMLNGIVQEGYCAPCLICGSRIWDPRLDLRKAMVCDECAAAID